jgi:hypothetical protein
MLRSAAAPYHESPCCMKQNQLETLSRIQIVCGAETFCTLLGSYTEL